MSDIASSRQAICDFLNEKKPIQAEKPAPLASNFAATAPLQALAALGAVGAGQAWSQHPLKQSYEQISPLAQDAVRQHPWLSLGAASALGALVVLSPGLRRLSLQALQGQLPPQVRELF
ncbi:MAG: hypothetical protein ACH34Y_00840 [Brachymonas sp.]|jgi:hypothetical protein